MEKTISKIISEFRTEVERIYADKLMNIILYGSYARGNENQNSDIDILLVIKGEISPGSEIDKMIDVITDINLKYNVLLSVLPVSYEDYYNTKSPLLMNVRKEGIPA